MLFAKVIKSKVTGPLIKTLSPGAGTTPSFHVPGELHGPPPVVDSTCENATLLIITKITNIKSFKFFI